MTSREVTDGVAAATGRSIGSRDPDALHFDAALDGADAKGSVFFGLDAHGSHWLRLKHLWSLCLLSLVDLGVLLQLVGVVP